MADAWLTQEELDELRQACKYARPIQVRLVRRLLADRDQWVQRAFATAHPARCPDCGMAIGHSEVCAGFARNDPANTVRSGRNEPTTEI